MKKFGWTYLFIAVVIALVGFTIFDFQRAEKEEAKKEQASTVLDFEVEKVTSLEFLGRGEKKTLDKAADGWRITAPFNDSADQQAVATFLESLKGERIQEVVKSGDAIQLATYGLDSPNFILKLVSDGKVHTLNIGSVKAYDGSLYGQLEGEKRVLLLSSAWDVYLSKPARELRDKRVYRGDPKAKPVSIKLTSETSPKFSLLLKRDQKENWVASPDAGNLISNKTVDAYIELVKALRAFDYMAFEKKNAKAVSSVGLDRPSYKLEVGFEGQVKPFSLQFALPKNQDDGNIPTLSSDLQQAVVVYKVAASKIMVEPRVFFDPKGPFQFPVSDVAQIRIQAPSLKPAVDKTISKDGPEWPKGQELIEKLSRLEALRFYDSKSFPVKGPSGSSMNSKIQLLKADGSLLLELAWGETIVEPAAGDKP
ncbi:MAG: DUF4340 domain-containing protein, partial [Proteobacteria bacterium]